LCPISATKDELVAQKCPIRLKLVCAANSRPVQISRKTPNRLKPVFTPAKAGHRLMLAHTSAKVGLDWYSQILFFFQNLSSFGDLDPTL
jgi:hypothetical protein